MALPNAAAYHNHTHTHTKSSNACGGDKKGGGKSPPSPTTTPGSGGAGVRTKNGVQQTKTLDTEHNMRLGAFEAKRNSVADMQVHLAALAARVEHLEARGRQQLSDAELEELLSALEEQRSLQRTVAGIQSRDDEIAYYTDICHIAFNYYDIVENGAPTTPNSGDPREPTTTPAAHDAEDVVAPGTGCVGVARGGYLEKKNSILKWFKPSDAATPKVYTTNDRASLLDKYLYSVDATHVRTTQANGSEDDADDIAVCPHCKDTRRTAMLHDGYIYCTSCFTVEYVLMDHDKPSYKDPPKEITYFAYKRINHFNEWLNTVQGKETTLIPDEMFDKILLELKKMRITNLSELSVSQMKEILKKLRPEGGNRYYEHIPYIISKLNGLPTPHLSPELEERLRHMFCQIQVPFLKHACELNPARQNFLSYSYVLNKFMQLLDKDQYLSSFPLLGFGSKSAGGNACASVRCVIIAAF